MPTANPGTVQFLKSPALFTKATAASAGTWTDRAVDSEIISPLALKAAADTEAARQIAFLEGPLVEDAILVPGKRKDLFGKVITAAGDPLDYSAGVIAFVIGFQESDSTTLLSIIRKLVP
jgi:hypothetical protein